MDIAIQTLMTTPELLASEARQELRFGFDDAADSRPTA